jgi:hypothetical protein
MDGTKFTVQNLKNKTMTTETVSNKMHSYVVQYDMHTDFFFRVLDGISDDDTHNRLGTKANHIAWLTGSLIEQRYELANMLGVEGRQAAFEMFKDNKGIQDGAQYPSLADYKKDWERISPLLRNALVNVDDAKLDEAFEMMPGMKMSHYEFISFVIYREANCIGQIALWRRLLGYEAMKYM